VFPLSDEEDGGNNQRENTFGEYAGADK